MQVYKRSGKPDTVHFDEITNRNAALSDGLDVDLTALTKDVISKMHANMTTAQIDELSCLTAVYKAINNMDYLELASRIYCSNVHKNTPPNLEKVLNLAQANINIVTGKPNPLLNDEYYNFAMEHIDKIERKIDYTRDYKFTFIAWKTLEKSYLIKVGGVSGKIIERPQHLFMRIALSIHAPNKETGKEGDIEKAFETYDRLSNFDIIHATPTLFNAGLKTQQCSSCFLMHIGDDLKEIFTGFSDAAMISKFAGGLGISLQMRGRNSYIAGTNGRSQGVLPVLKILNEIAKFVDQCVPGNTLVYTNNGPIAIENLHIGDTVLTDEGNFKRVKAVKKDFLTKDLFGLKLDNLADTFWATAEHPVAIVSQYDMVKLLTSGEIHAQFLEIEKINKGDFVLYRIPELVKDVPELSADLCLYYGLIAGCEQIVKNDERIQVGCKDQNVAKKLSQLLSQFGVQSKILDCIICNSDSYEEKTCKNCDDSLSTKDRVIYLQYNHISLLPHDADAQHIPNNLLHLPVTKLSEFLGGFLSNSAEEIRTNVYRISAVDRLGVEFRAKLQYIAMRLGLSFKKGNEISLNEEDNFVYGNFIFAQVMEMFHKPQVKDWFYDLYVDENPNYTTFQGGALHNGGGLRKASIAVFMSPEHIDIEQFLEIRLNSGNEDLRARDIFPGLMVPNLFIKRVEEDAIWSLFDPSTVPDLWETFGAEYERIYRAAEKEGKFVKQVPARLIWKKILHSLAETGLPYVMMKDNINTKNMQGNLPIIKGSNLCCEIVEHHDKDSIAVCTLGSVCLTNHVTEDNKVDYAKIRQSVSMLVENLNNIIDLNKYPLEKAKKNSHQHRPIGIGVTGLSDLFQQIGVCWESKEAKLINRCIFEHMYYAAVSCSANLAKECGKTYDSYEGSPISKGILNFDLWDTKPITADDDTVSEYFEPLDWDILRRMVKKNGVRNSLLIALMPTVSTSAILSASESFEPLLSNLFVRKLSSGEFIIQNKYLYKKLKELELWTPELVNQLLISKGSVQNIDAIPDDIKQLFKTVWEIPQKCLMELSADRAPFVDQTQSFNVYLRNPTISKLSSLYSYAAKLGLKTASYYTRSDVEFDAIKFGIAPEEREKHEKKKKEQLTICDGDVCLSCQ